MKNNPYPEEHAVRYREPLKKIFVRIRRINDEFGKGIDALYGILRHKIGNRKTEIQAIRFDAHKYSITYVVGWVREHMDKFGTPIKIEEATYQYAHKTNPQSTMITTEAQYKKILAHMLEDEQEGIKAYKKFILSLPINPEANKVCRILSEILADEERHEKILLRLAIF